MSKPRAGALLAAKDRARREGWAKWIRSEADERALLEGYRFDTRRADHITEFFPRFLVHAKNKHAGKPFELLRWQRDELLAPMFGWVRRDGLRRFRRAYVEIPKKNGKSTLAAGLGLYMLAADGEHGSQVYSAAADRDQASIVHGEAIAMVDAAPKLARQLRINRSTKTIFFDARNSKYKALSAAPGGKEGLDGHCAIIDELHIWKGRALWDALRYMGRGRPEPLIFVITTAGADREGVCWEQREYAQRVIDGSITDHRYFPLIYAATEAEVKGDRVFDRDLWHRVNPSMGETIDPDEFEADLKEALNSPSSKPSFLRYSFNIWSRSVGAWLDSTLHDENAEAYTEEELEGETCYAALDVAKLLDMTALSLLFPCRENPGTYRRIHRFWMPEATAYKRQDVCPQLLQWAQDGYLKLTDGDVCDYAVVRADIEELANRFSIQELAFDPWNAEAITQDIETATGIERVEFRQTIGNFADPTAEYEKLLRERRMLHNGNPVIGWQMGHVQVKTDPSGNIRPVKPPRGDHKTIDGIVSDIMALARAIQAEQPAEGELFIF